MMIFNVNTPQTRCYAASADMLFYLHVLLSKMQKLDIFQTISDTGFFCRNVLIMKFVAVAAFAFLLYFDIFVINMSTKVVHSGLLTTEKTQFSFVLIRINNRSHVVVETCL